MATSSVSTSLASSLAVSGLASGMNWQSTVQQLANAERAPENQWRESQATILQQNAAFSTIKSDLATLQTDAQALQDATLYDSRSAQSSDSELATATADPGATVGQFSLNISRLATAARILGAGNINAVLVPGGDLNAVTLGTAGLASPVTAGAFTVNGHQVTVAKTDSLQQLFDKIAAATNNTVTASYNAATDKISLASSDQTEIVLGSATDTSNFLQAARLFNNGTGSITSTAALGSVRTGAALTDAGLATAVTDGGSGQGAFTINGVTINYNASTDSIDNLLARINDSGAGVTASFDAQNQRFVVANQVTGDLGITLQDVTGNFLAATGLATGSLSHGQNLLYTVNGGPQQVSQSNTITNAAAGLSVTALAQGAVTITVASDTSKIKSAIQTFIKDYNLTQSFISQQMAVTTGSDGKVTAGVLTGSRDAADLADSLRSLSAGMVSVSGLSSAFSRLSSLGIQTNGKTNTLSLDDSTALDNTLAGNLNSVKAFFSDASGGLAKQLNTYLDATIGDNGTLTNHQSSLTKRSSSIDDQVAALETKIKADSAHWTAEFRAMETAQARINQELQYLTQQISNGTL